MKTAAHEKVTVLPTDKTAGYTCIYDNKIYILQTDGSWLIDTDFSYGSSLSLVGLNGNKNEVATYLNAPSYIDRKSPFFMTGNTNDLTNCTYWNDIIGINRTGDFIFINQNGDSFLNSISVDVNKMVVDSLNNLWIASIANGIHKFESGEKTSVFTPYVIANHNLPFDTITDIIVDGIELWIIYADATEIKIAHYDGYVWEDLTAQMESDLTATKLDCDDLTAIKYYDMFADDDRVMFSFTDASVTGNLFYYDKTSKTFFTKTLPSAFTGNYLQKFLKVDDQVFSLVSSSATPGVGKLWVWLWSTGTVQYTESTNNMTDLVTDGVTVYLWTTSKIQSVVIPGFTPADEKTMEAAIAAELTSPATLTLVDMALGPDGKMVFLNLFDNGGTMINNIIESIPDSQWVVTAR